MNEVPPALWMFWGLTVAGLALFAGAVATRRLRLSEILTGREWKAAFQIVAIIAMALTLVYFTNAGRYDASEFIYGRF